MPVAVESINLPEPHVFLVNAVAVGELFELAVISRRGFVLFPFYERQINLQ